MHSRVYPEVNVGDYVRIYKKKDKLDKERVPMWTKDKHRVERVEESMGQKIYYVTLRPGKGNRPKGLIRSNILLVSWNNPTNPEQQHNAFCISEVLR